MTITVKLFAILRDRAGLAHTTVDALAGSTVKTLSQTIADRYPAIVPYLPRVAFAVNEEYVPADTELHDGDELALIPPVSGG